MDTRFEQGIIVGHDAFRGFIERYDIPYYGALTDIHDNPVPPNQRRAIQDAIKNEDVSCLILDASEPSPQLEDFARENNISHVYVDVLGWSFLEPNSDNFYELFFKQLGEAFSNCAISELAPLTAQ